MLQGLARTPHAAPLRWFIRAGDFDALGWSIERRRPHVQGMASGRWATLRVAG